jgi:subtilisin family serine protease
MQVVLFTLLFILLELSSANGANSLAARCNGNDRVPFEYIIRSKSISSKNIVGFLSGKMAPGQSLVRKLNYNHRTNVQITRAHIESESELNSIVSDPSTLSVEENCNFTLHNVVPNDPELSRSWQHDIIRLHQAWDIKHDTSVVVAIPDTGIQIDHPDLIENIWVNEKEKNGQAGVDDDQNGYIDDIYGWSQSDENNDVFPGAYASSDHGTHVAGIIGAVGDNSSGIVGVAWHVKMMVLRPFSKSQESATTADLLESIYYAVNNGAQIINCSWGANHEPSAAELDAYSFAEQHGVLVIASAGNENTDASQVSPANIHSVLAIGSINSDLEFSTFSNFGSVVPILAPGGDAVNSFGYGKDELIYSTSTGGGYSEKRGTSFSAPLVTGVAALVKSLLPNIKPTELRRLLVESSSRTLYRKNGVDQFYGILNAERTLSLAKELSVVDPMCSENCAFSGGSLSIKTQTSTFGGGCQMNLRAQDTFRSSESSPWDLALIISSMVPKFISFLARRRKLRTRKSQETR